MIDVGHGSAAVLLHGQPGSGGDWQAVVARVAPRMRVIVPDRPGYGESRVPATGFAGNARAVAALLDGLGIDSAVVAGHSWATGAALAAALYFPERVRALVLTAPVAPGIPPTLVDRALAHRLLGPPLVMTGFKLAGLALAVRPLRKLAARAVPQLPPAQVAATAAAWRSARVWRSFYAEQRALVAELPCLAGALSSLNKRTIVVYGTRDRISPPLHARRLAAVLPSVEVVAADGAGHLLPQQRPDLVAEAILSAGTSCCSA